MQVHKILALLSARRFRLGNEKALQAEIAAELAAHSVDFRREVNLGEGDIIDFIVGQTGIEVKIKGGKREIYRQIERYAKHASIKELILVTNVPTGFPREVEGKPVYVSNLSRAWL